MIATADVAVVGAGIVGLATAYALHRRGVGVAIYERGVPGNGQSGGDSRIFRHTHEDPGWCRWRASPGCSGASGRSTPAVSS